MWNIIFLKGGVLALAPLKKEEEKKQNSFDIFENVY